MIAISIIILFILLFTGLPIGYTLALTGLFFLCFSFGPSIMTAVPEGMYDGLDSFVLLAIPLFVLTGYIMTQGKIVEKLVQTPESLVGHFKSGLVIVLIAVCVFFAAISGSSAATIAAVGTMMLPEMIKRGYNARYSTGLLAVAAGIGILIPPSIPMIVYSSQTSTSVAKLFLAGAIPGFLLALILLIISLFVFKHGEQESREKKYTWKERGRYTKESIWGLFLPIIIFGGIYGGIFTPTEAAGVAAVYAFFISVVVLKSIKMKDILNILSESAVSASIILIIIAGAKVFGKVLAYEKIPQTIVDSIMSNDLSPLLFILIVNIILIIMGLFLESISILVLTMPILFPAAQALGIDPLHFAALFVVNMEIAFITPPVGINLYLASSISNRPILDTLRGTFPFAIGVFIVLAIVSYWPPLSTWLPGLLD